MTRQALCPVSGVAKVLLVSYLCVSLGTGTGCIQQPEPTARPAVKPVSATTRPVRRPDDDRAKKLQKLLDALIAGQALKPMNVEAVKTYEDFLAEFQKATGMSWEEFQAEVRALQKKAAGIQSLEPPQADELETVLAKLVAQGDSLNKDVREQVKQASEMLKSFKANAALLAASIKEMGADIAKVPPVVDGIAAAVGKLKDANGPEAAAAFAAIFAEGGPVSEFANLKLDELAAKYQPVTGVAEKVKAEYEQLKSLLGKIQDVLKSPELEAAVKALDDEVQPYAMAVLSFASSAASVLAAASTMGPVATAIAAAILLILAILSLIFGGGGGGDGGDGDSEGSGSSGTATGGGEQNGDSATPNDAGGPPADGSHAPNGITAPAGATTFDVASDGEHGVSVYAQDGKVFVTLAAARTSDAAKHVTVVIPAGEDFAGVAEALKSNQAQIRINSTFSLESVAWPLELHVTHGENAWDVTWRSADSSPVIRVG